MRGDMGFGLLSGPNALSPFSYIQATSNWWPFFFFFLN